jgi:hypothetical protein
MTPAERRREGASRVIRLHEDDGAFDRAAWVGTSVQERLEALWDLTLDYLAWTAPDGPEPRLQRSVCVLERRGR